MVCVWLWGSPTLAVGQLPPVDGPGLFSCFLLRLPASSAFGIRARQLAAQAVVYAAPRVRAVPVGRVAGA